MPLLALSAKARLMVPVGAIDSRCELRMPVARIFAFSSCGKSRGKGWCAQIKVGIEQREGAALQIDRGGVRGVTHQFGNARRHRPRLGVS